jgi:hypothetical protein
MYPSDLGHAVVAEAAGYLSIDVAKCRADAVNVRPMCPLITNTTGE